MARIIETTKTRSYHDVKDIVNEFANGPYDVIKVKVNMDEWKNPLSCQSSFRQAIRRSKYDIQVFRRKKSNLSFEVKGKELLREISGALFISGL